MIRKGLIVCFFILTGCVSQSQPGMLGDNFDTEQAAKTRMSLGLTYLKNGQYSQAKKNLDKALEFGPRQAQVHYAMAYYYQAVEDKARAVEYFENAMDLAPRDADIANSYGAYLCAQGEYEQANKYFTQAIKNQRYSNAVLTYENMGICAAERGFHDDAINYFNDALNHQPSRAKTLFLLAQEYVATARWEKASDALKRYEKVSSISPDSLWLAVEIARGQKDLESQQAYGAMLVSMYPDSAQAREYEIIRTDKPVLKRKQKAKSRRIEAPMQREAGPDSEASRQPPDHAAENSNVQSSSHSDKHRGTETKSEATESKRTEKMTKVRSGSEESARQQRIHVVQEAENLYRISVTYNIKMSTLQKWNQLTDSDLLEAGTRLWLGPPEQQTN